MINVILFLYLLGVFQHYVRVNNILALLGDDEAVPLKLFVALIWPVVSLWALLNVIWDKVFSNG